jgi:hypothetical protein
MSDDQSQGAVEMLGSILGEESMAVAMLVKGSPSATPVIMLSIDDRTDSAEAAMCLDATGAVELARALLTGAAAILKGWPDEGP